MAQFVNHGEGKGQPFFFSKKGDRWKTVLIEHERVVSFKEIASFWEANRKLPDDSKVGKTMTW